MELKSGVDDDTSTLAWLIVALEQARTHGEGRLVNYLQAVSDDAIFEVEMAARRALLVSKLTQNKTA